MRFLGVPEIPSQCFGVISIDTYCKIHLHSPTIEFFQQLNIENRENFVVRKNSELSDFSALYEYRIHFSQKSLNPIEKLDERREIFKNQ